MISVVIPVYNVAPFLRECLESVKNQTFTDFEAILINDGSTDDSLKICQEFVATDTRFRFFSQKNKGLGPTRNKGIYLSKGDYLTFLDSDDWWEPDMLATLYRTLTRQNADISCCGYFVEELHHSQAVWTKGAVEVWNTPKALSKLFINKEMKDFMWAKLYKKELFQNIEIPSGAFEDIFVMYRIFAQARKVVKISAPKYHYRVGHSSFSFNANKCVHKWESFISALYEQFLFVEENSHKIENVPLVKFAQMRMIFRAKKQSIQNFSVFSQEFKELSAFCNPKLKYMLSSLTYGKYSLRYWGAWLSLYVPVLFSFPYWFSRKK